MKKLLSVTAAAALAGIVLGFAVFGIIKFLVGSTPPPDSDNASGGDIAGCYVEEFFAYSGEYPEDGSFAQKQGVAAVRIKNATPFDIRYARITVKTQNESYAFSASSWLAGTEMTVLESTGRKAEDGFLFETAKITDVEAFDAVPSLLEDKFEISFENGSVSVKNKTEADLPGGMTVYFKAEDENGFFGGITFMVRMPGIKAGAAETVDTGIASSKAFIAVFAEEYKEEMK